MLTVTVSKKPSTGRRSPANAVIASPKFSRSKRPATARRASVRASPRRRLRRRFEPAGVDRAVMRLTVLLGLDPDDIGGPAVGRQQIGAIVGAEEPVEGGDPIQQSDEVVLAAEREDGVDQVVPDALLAQGYLEAVGEEAHDRIAEVGHGGIQPVAMGRCSRRDNPAQTESEPVLDDQADDAEGCPTQREWVPAAVGRSPMPKKPTRVSSLSASATATAAGAVGQASDGPCGA